MLVCSLYLPPLDRIFLTWINIADCWFFKGLRPVTVGFAFEEPCNELLAATLMSPDGTIDLYADSSRFPSIGELNCGDFMKGHWIILGGEVTDIEAQQEYRRLWQPIAKKYGALLKKLDTEALKESGGSSRVIAVEFESYAQVKTCYEDPAYTEAKAFALRASSRQLIIIAGELA